MSKSLFNRPIMSLRTGGQVGWAVEPIINPHNLKILGWWCKMSGNGQSLVLLAEDVREMMPTGLAVNDEDALATIDELVRHRDILEVRFELLDKLVKTKKHKLGKVSDFSYNDGMLVQKLYVARPMTKIFSSDDLLLIDRSQILEVTDSYILVRDAEVKATDEELAGAAVPA